MSTDDTTDERRLPLLDREEPSESDSESGAGVTASRRDVLKGSGLFASSMFAGGELSVPDDPLGMDDGTVPDEPTHDGQVRKFTVHAIEADIVYNRYGLHQPNAAVYVLKEDLQEAREASGKIPCGNTAVDLDSPFCDEIPDHECADDVDTRVLQPLSLRANRGDIVEIEFHNDLPDRTASIHQTSLPYEVEENDGMDVGYNPDTTVEPGESITYRWHADHFGVHSFLDGANQAVDSADAPPEEANLTARGLFGSVSVYPQGTTWTDPFTGEERQGRVQADVHVPDDISQDAIDEGFVSGVSYRDIKLHYHSPPGVYTKDGDQLTWPESDEPQSVHAINYRADPTGSRINADRCPACDSSEFYSSWIHGDPGGGDNVYPTYLGDPVKVTAVGASIEENHVHHLHGHRWKEVPDQDGSDTVDSQTVGLGAVYETPLVPAFGQPEGTIDDFETVRPDMEYEEAFQVGVGGAHGSPGDYLFHCHLFPHYAEGMWGMMRALDKETEQLEKLPTNEPPIPEDSDIPGYPEFIPGEFGLSPPFPPYGAAGLDDFRDPTPEEEKALTRKGDILPGAPYTDPCDPDIDVPGYDGPDGEFDGELREYTIVALPADVVYNDDGHHDPEGIVYALEEDAEKIRKGEMNPEPLVIRANVGDCVEITLKNEVEEDVEPVPVARDDLNQGGGKSNHIHFVSYDVLGSDSLANGFNYNQQSLPDRPLPSRWYPDEEGTIFFHDHITGVENVMNGSFCALIVEPEGSEWLDPYSGEPIRSGTQAMIKNPDGDDFREYGLAFQDFAQLVDRDGDFVNPGLEHNENAGVMAINYRNAPYYTREEGDPAYVHSSFVHGDPATPLLEAYEDDPVRFRVWQATYEEQHNFNLHGREFSPEGLDPEDAITQIIGTSEAYTFDVLPEEGIVEEDGDNALAENPAGLPIRDFAYGSTIVDDLWDGMWGIHRVFGAEVDHLQPLPDRGTPDGEISDEELEKMGHPAPFSDFDWTEYGQKAKLLYSDHGHDHDHGHGHDHDHGHDHGDNHDKRYPPDKDARQNESIDGNPPPVAPAPGEPCPEDAEVKRFDVSAFQTTIDYNEYGDQDPLGTVFALDEHVEGIKNGDRPAHPLTLWVNEGDCVEINLTNRLNERSYEIDLVVGEIAELLEEDPMDFYGSDERLVRSARGSLGESATRNDADRGPRLADELDESIDSELIEVEDGVATVEFTVEDESGLTLSLASYGEGDDGSAPNGPRELHDAATDTFGPGTHTLTVEIPPGPEFIGDDHAHPQMRTKEENLDIEWERSDRISLHPGRVTYDVLGSDGATVGFNWDQTVGPDETITYRWFADEPVGSAVLWDHADIRSNRHHGAYGQLLVQNGDVGFADPATAEPLIQGLSVESMLNVPDGFDRREFALLFADAQYIVNPTTDVCVVPPGFGDEADPDAPCNQIPDDPEDQGYPSINYASEPFIRRFQREGETDPPHVYDSERHGDPATPLPRALLGDPVQFRVNKAADKARGLSFHLSDHQWDRLRGVEDSENIGVDDRFTVGKADRVDPFGGAGGLADSTGDFIYQELKMRRRLEGGFWGIFRVRESFEEFENLVQPLPEAATDRGIMPEDRPGWNVARGDLTGNGVPDLLVGVPASDIAGRNAGAAYLLLDRGTEPIPDLLDAEVAILGPESGAQLGTEVAIQSAAGGEQAASSVAGPTVEIGSALGDVTVSANQQLTEFTASMGDATTTPGEGTPSDPGGANGTLPDASPEEGVAPDVPSVGDDGDEPLSETTSIRDEVDESISEISSSVSDEIDGSTSADLGASGDDTVENATSANEAFVGRFAETSSFHALGDAAAVDGRVRETITGDVDTVVHLGALLDR